MAKEIRVVVVEQHNLMRQALRALLEQQPGIKVVGEASDAQQTVDLVARFNPDVVITVLSPLEPDPPKAVQYIKTTAQKVEVLVLGTDRAQDYILALLQAGATGYLLQDCTIDKLVRGIKQASTGELVLQPNLTRIIIAQLAKKRPAFETEAASKRISERIRLTEREMEIVQLLAQGYANKDIAQKLYLSVRTIEGHLASIYTKLGVHSRTEAALYAVRKGWVLLDS